MNDEIKEILDYFRTYATIKEVNMIKKVYDYITNLQEKVNQYENPDDMTLFYMWLDEKAKDKIKQLQEENERLKELCDTYEEEHSTRFNDWVFDKRENERLKAREEECMNAYLRARQDVSEYEGKYVVAKYVIDELEKWLKDYINLLNKPDVYEEQTLEDLKEVLDKLKALKEGK